MSLHHRRPLLMLALALAAAGTLATGARAQTYWPLNETGSTTSYVHAVAPGGIPVIPFIHQGVDRWITRDASNQFPAPEIVTISATPDHYVTAIHLTTYASWALDLLNGAEVGQVVVHFFNGAPDVVLPLVIGVNTAEWSYDRPEAVDCLAHSKIRDLESYSFLTTRDSQGSYYGHNYYTSVAFEGGYPSSMELRINPYAYQSEVQGGTTCGTYGKFNVGVNGVTLEGWASTPAKRPTWGSLKSLYR